MASPPLFDKTGTLTKGQPAVIDLAAVHDTGTGRQRLLALAGAVEADSKHPLARAIATAAKDAGATAVASDFRSLTGRGVQAVVEGQKVAVGGPALLRETGAEVPTGLAERTRPWSERGAAVLYVVADGEIVGALALADEVRPESEAAIDALHAQGIHV